MIIFYTCLIIGFGLFETISNLIYLKDGSGIVKAYQQHREIPSSVSLQRMNVKVKTMLLIGLSFLISGGLSFLYSEIAVLLIRFPLSLYALYTFIEALYYKKHLLGWALAILINVLAISAWILI